MKNPCDPQLVYAIDDSLYLNISNRCTLECTFCPKTQGSHQVHDYDLSITKQPSSDEIISQIELLDDKLIDYKEVVFCGFGEPTLRLQQLKAVASYLKSKNIKVRLNTDGLANLVHKRNILLELKPLIDSISISLNSDDERSYIKHCQPQLKHAYKAVLEFIRLAPNYINDVRVTAINGLEQVNIHNCQQIAYSAGANFLARELDVIG
ncbi:MAG: radical SAM protein [Kangiellaceae bacterium]|nr:radical SAM protein [Kangiellaceae bacterium]